MALVALLGSACLPRGEITLPEADADAQSLIVHLHTGSAEELWVMRPDDPLPVSVDRAWPRDANMRAYALPWSMEALQLPVGTFPGGLRGDRTLPQAHQSWRGEWTEATLRWKPSPDHEGLSDLRWPSFDWNTCLESQGCAPRETGGPPRCSPSCAIPAPQHPSPPQPPQGTVYVEARGGQYASTLADRVVCAGTERQAYGDPECSALGPCPSGWPQPPAHSGQTWYVSQAGGGLGNAASPFASLAEALAVFRPGDVILVDEGDYQAPITLTQDVLIVQGRCAARTSVGLQNEYLRLGGPNIQLLDLALPEVRVIAGRAHLQRVAWTQTASTAMRVAGAEATVSDALFDGTGNFGIVATQATVQLDNVVFRDTLRGALLCRDQSQCAAARLAVRGARHAGGPGEAAVLAQSSTVSLDGFIIEDSEIDAVAADLGSHVEAQRGVVRNRRIPGSPTNGVGARARNRSTMQLQDVFIDGAHASGLRVTDRAELTAADVVVQNTYGDGASTFFVARDGRLSVQRLYAFEPEAAFSYTFDEAGSFLITDGTMVSTALISVVLQALLHLDAAHNRLTRVRLVSGGAKVIDTTPNTGAQIELFDVRTEGGSESLRVNRGNSVIADRVQLMGASTRGIGISAGIPELEGRAQLAANNLSITANQGTGLLVMSYGQVSMSRFEIKMPTADVGVMIQEQGQASLSEGQIDGPLVGMILQAGAAAEPQDVLRSVLVGARTPIIVE